MTVLEKAGLFDPSFFVYSEEDDLCKRVKNHGFRVVFTPDAEIIHFGGQTSKQMPLKMALVQLDSKIKYFYKHAGPIHAALLRAVIGGGALLRLFGWGAICVVRSKHSELARERVKEYAAAMKLISRWKPTFV
jgi:GT2 family glycosyltransferase